MGPRLRVSKETFLKEVEKNPGKVIRGPKVILQGYTYLTCGKDYYYYTLSKELFTLPEDVELTIVDQILL